MQCASRLSNGFLLASAGFKNPYTCNEKLWMVRVWRFLHPAMKAVITPFGTRAGIQCYLRCVLQLPCRRLRPDTFLSLNFKTPNGVRCLRPIFPYERDACKRKAGACSRHGDACATFWGTNAMPAKHKQMPAADMAMPAPQVVQ